MQQTTSIRRTTALIVLLAVLALLVPLAPAATGTAATGIAVTGIGAAAHSGGGHTARTAKAKAKAAKAAKARAAARASALAARQGQIAADWVSIMAKQDARLAHAGWSTCGTVTWSIDPKSLASGNVERELGHLRWAFGQWSEVTGVQFQYVGEIATSYVASTGSLTPADGRSRDRHIYLSWMSPSQAGRLGGGAMAIAAPSAIDSASGEIHGGRAIFESGFVNGASSSAPNEVKAVYLHELGHVIGLGHATLDANTMYPYVYDDTTLGAGDIAGAHALTRTCAA